MVQYLAHMILSLNVWESVGLYTELCVMMIVLRLVVADSF